MSLSLLYGILTGCGDSSKPNSGDSSTPKSDSVDKEYSVTVTPPEGWETFSDGSTLLRYRKDSGDFWVKQSPLGGSLESEIEYYREREKEGGYDIVWDDAEDVKTGGMDAKHLKYTISTKSLTMRYDAYFIPKGNMFFTVICLTTPDSDYATMESDYKALLDSLAIAEK